jgi:hypothetical protein
LSDAFEIRTVFFPDNLRGLSFGTPSHGL